MLKIIGGIVILLGLIIVIVQPLITDIIEDTEIYEKIIDIVFLFLFIVNSMAIIYEMFR